MSPLKSPLRTVTLCALVIGYCFFTDRPQGFQGFAQGTQSRQLDRQTDSVKTWPIKAKRWALVIGVDQYRDGQINALKGSVNDAHNLANALVRYAGFPQDQVIVLTTDQPEERQPTRINILTYLSNLASLVPKDGLLLVSFAGHGIERGGQAYLIPSDARLSRDVSLLEESAVSVTRMHDRIKAIGVGQVIVLLDACRNDPGGRAGAPNNMGAAYTKFNFDVRNREVEAFATFYATAIGQRAYEYTEKHQGYFTWAIVEGLKGAAANEKGEVTLAALVKYVQDNVPKRIAIDLGASEQQKPFATIEGYRADELVVAVAGPNAGNASSASTAATTDPVALEMSFWESIKNSTDPADFQSYLEKFPNGTFAPLAKKRVHPNPSPASTEALAMPTIDQVLERHVQAIGGRSAIEKTTTRITTGSLVQIQGKTNLSLTFTIYQKAPNKTVYVSSGGAQEGFNGVIGWVKGNRTGLRQKAGEQLALARRESDFYFDTRIKELYARIAFLRRDRVGGRDVYVFEAAPAEGKPDTLYFDAETALLVRQDIYFEGSKGKPAPTEIYYEDYREVDGIKLPFTIRQVYLDYSTTLKVYDVKHNVPIEDSKFDGPSKK
jgi:hypothetical protein